MSGIDPNPNMQQWLNPQQPAQPAPQPVQPPVQPAQPAPQQWFMNPQTGQNELYELNPQLNQWVPVQTAQPPAPIAPPPVPPAQPQFAQPAPQPVQPPQAPQQAFSGQQGAFPAQPPMPPMMPGQSMPGQSPISISQQMELEQMRQANASRANAAPGENAPVSLKMSLKGVAAGNFNLVPVDLVYESKITKAETKLVDAKTHYMIVLSMVIVFPNEYRGTMLRNNINLTEESLGFYRAALEATDLFNYETEEPTLNNEQEFVGKIVRHAVSHREWKGEPRNNVNGAFSKAFESDEAKALNGTLTQPGMAQMPQMPQQAQQVPAQPFAQTPQQQYAFTAPTDPAAASAPPTPAFAPPTGYAAPDPNGNTPQPIPSQPNFGQ